MNVTHSFEWVEKKKGAVRRKYTLPFDVELK